VRRLQITVKMDDGAVYEVTSKAADVVKYELEGPRRGWPKLADAPNTWETAVAYFALLRTKQISMPWEKFLAELEDINSDVLAAPEVAPFPKELSLASSPNSQ
jgi:hypothetical protein